MPLQEAMVWGRTTPLARPAGAGFGAPCASKENDAKVWMRAIPKLRKALENGHFVGVLVQTRNHRPWDDDIKNYRFTYAEDYMVAAYTIAPALGSPWLPGRMIMDWLNLFSFTRAGAVQYQPTAGLDQVFQCSPAGCKLSKLGAATLMRMFNSNGSSQGEAYAMSLGNFLRPENKARTGRVDAGWLGGDFAAVV
jgi:hypothetical protein